MGGETARSLFSFLSFLMVWTCTISTCDFYGNVPMEMLVKDEPLEENQDGGVGRHAAPPRTTRTDRKSNGKEVRHQGNTK